jgi:hypothetical protein
MIDSALFCTRVLEILGGIVVKCNGKLVHCSSILIEYTCSVKVNQIFHWNFSSFQFGSDKKVK